MTDHTIQPMHACTAALADPTCPQATDADRTDRATGAPDAAGSTQGASRPGPTRTVPARGRRTSRRGSSVGQPRPICWLVGSRRRPRLPAAGRLSRGVFTVAVAGLVVAASAGPAFAEPPKSLNEVIGRITAWLVGIAAGLATLFLTYGAVRYLSAGGDPASVEKAKTALRSAAVGYGLAVLAPLVVTVLATFVS